MEFFGMIAKGMMAYADFVWGWPLLIGTSFVAVFMSVRLGFFQFTYFGHVINIKQTPAFIHGYVVIKALVVIPPIDKPLTPTKPSLIPTFSR